MIWFVFSVQLLRKFRRIECIIYFVSSLVCLAEVERVLLEVIFIDLQFVSEQFIHCKHDVVVFSNF